MLPRNHLALQLVFQVLAYPSEGVGKSVALPVLLVLEHPEMPVELPVELVQMLLAVYEPHSLQLQQLDDLVVTLLDVALEVRRIRSHTLTTCQDW